jgi:hypothetical protein
MFPGFVLPVRVHDPTVTGEPAGEPSRWADTSYASHVWAFADEFSTDERNLDGADTPPDGTVEIDAVTNAASCCTSVPNGDPD